MGYVRTRLILIISKLNSKHENIWTRGHLLLGQKKRIKEINTPYKIQYEAFANAGGLYDERHAKLYAEFEDNLIANGSFSIVYKDVAHACYIPITIDKAPHMKCYVLAPLAVLPEYQRKGYATRLMEEAEKQLDADVIFVMGEPFHYGNRYNMPHNVLPPVRTKTPLECWFARELTEGALKGISESTSSIKGPYAEPLMWGNPSEQV